MEDAASFNMCLEEVNPITIEAPPLYVVHEPANFEAEVNSRLRRMEAIKAKYKK